VLEGVVSDHDSRYGLLSLMLPGDRAALRFVHDPLNVGKPLRVTVKARDVSLMTGIYEHEFSSVLNVLPAKVIEIADDVMPAQVVVRLDVDGSPLLARITRYSLERLGIRVGMQVWAQVKAVSLLA
jgi:molybdate transport system ATP-binding protein